MRLVRRKLRSSWAENEIREAGANALAMEPPIHASKRVPDDLPEDGRRIDNVGERGIGPPTTRSSRAGPLHALTKKSLDDRSKSASPKIEAERRGAPVPIPAQGLCPSGAQIIFMYWETYQCERDGQRVSTRSRFEGQAGPPAPESRSPRARHFIRASAGRSRAPIRALHKEPGTPASRRVQENLHRLHDDVGVPTN
jgi:hypothetical protein